MLRISSRSRSCTCTRSRSRRSSWTRAGRLNFRCMYANCRQYSAGRPLGLTRNRLRQYAHLRLTFVIDEIVDEIGRARQRKRPAVVLRDLADPKRVPSPPQNKRRAWLRLLINKSRKHFEVIIFLCDTNRYPVRSPTMGQVRATHTKISLSK